MASMVTQTANSSLNVVQSIGRDARSMVANVTEDAINVAERITGIDLDKDGDVGVKGQGKWAQFKEGAAKLKRKYQQSDENPYQCFRLGQFCSWFVILLCFIVFVVTLGSLSAADHARTIICKRPELAAGLNSNVTTCQQVVSCFAECNDQYDVVSTKGFRDCFLGNADRSIGSPLVVDSPCTLDAGTVAYNVARYYRNSSVDADLARLRFREEVMLSYAPPRPVDAVTGVSSRRRQAAEVRPPLPARRGLNPVALAWAMTRDRHQWPPQKYLPHPHP